jgi:hypothetical protein
MGMITCRKCGHSFGDFGWLCPRCWPRLFAVTILIDFTLLVPVFLLVMLILVLVRFWSLL